MPKIGRALPQYRVGDDSGPVAPRHRALARDIDTNRDRILSDAEIVTYLRRPDVDILRDPAQARVDAPRIIGDFKAHLRGQRPLRAEPTFRSFAQIEQELADLERRYPDTAQRVSLGKTVEGRDIWALKISSNVRGDTSSKPGVVLTGLHHAREWVTPEVVMETAKALLTGTDAATRQRLDKTELWLIPVSNPDGMVYSHAEDRWWRKNRRRFSQGVGVDLNRNYFDARRPDLYRFARDQPNRTDDDFGASDTVRYSDYRGPAGASEPEVQALQRLESGRANIQGVMDLHSYGDLILYPWGYSAETSVDNVAAYLAVARKINESVGGSFRITQSADLYPTTGSSEDFHQINGKMSITLELGSAFHPDEEELKESIPRGVTAALTFIDHFAR